MTSERFIRIGIDVGDVRVGCARSDLDGLIATPVETFQRPTAAAKIAELCIRDEARRVMIGLPRSLNGSEGAAADKARRFADELHSALGDAAESVDIRFIDERLTTVSAHQALRSSGRKTKQHRSVVDQVAAVMILQTALDQERSTGRAAGIPLN
ncbi:Holliday junction resolvase RuvX [Helcobacillus massiliensis]|uniref:Holliday junction resolvase RuvX n=1 Tax=Helcobacillus massiliensis TaxID=521392 RepID=UPI0021A4EB36|nr:Holliday junction resolvase RuvX [Helcobacillus massiliensis]MCT1557102.1 Holliday junction resolvase RuvX [Helcobacillus massiliensis]MCT2036163.1 Holliday junction resolvase RuvX [Helcobacillus massiliensis]MCT2331294.1 Holliday junction resolvase RuvX [Helcobacillus massiliensis]